MVNTRRSGATEPLERLETPPKRTRKLENPIVSSVQQTRVDEILKPFPEVARAVTVKRSVLPYFENIPQSSELNHYLTSSQAVTASNTASTKRRHQDVEPLEQESPTKRSRTEPASDDEYLLMFPKKAIDEQENLSEPPKSLVDSFRRNRRISAMSKRPGRFSSLPRQRTPMNLAGDNPFGIETFSRQELADQAAQIKPQDVSTNKEQQDEREERSAAPEPETPKRSLFGSLRDIGSATIGRVLLPFNRLNSQQSASLPHPRTEPAKRVKVWDIEYPEVPSLQDENDASGTGDYDENTNTEVSRAEGDEAGRKSDRRHRVFNTGVRGNQLASQRRSESRSESRSTWHEEVNVPNLETYAQRRRAARQNLDGKAQQPNRTPLFGPNSHYARGTKDPVYQSFFEGSDHPAMRQVAGSKRSISEALPEEATQARPSTRSFQPHVDEDDHDMDLTHDAPSTPPNKRQKMAGETIFQTPRSALKAPGSIGRGGRSARFNENPIASIKRMSPISGTAPAGSPSPTSLFQTLSDLQSDSPASNNGLTPSPNTVKNTLANTGKQQRPELLFKQHPGDLLSQAMNDATPEELRGTRVPYIWNDPQNPSWKPSLFNPRPGTFRFIDEEEETEEKEYLADLERGESGSPEPSTPEPPSTPRMSHAELPKSSAIGAAAFDSTSAFEAANLERRRADATKTKPRKASRLAEVTSARSRSPSPPGLDMSDAAETSDESAKTPSPVIGPAVEIWSWNSATNEYISSSPKYPDFAYNTDNELIPAFAIRSAAGEWDNVIKGPDGMTELMRQNTYRKKYDDIWAQGMFKFESPQTYEEAGVGSKYIHDLIRKNDSRYPEVVEKCDERFAGEWNAHQEAIDKAINGGGDLVATFPDRDGIEMLDADDEL